MVAAAARLTCTIDPTNPAISTTFLAGTFWSYVLAVIGGLVGLLGLAAVMTPANWR